MSILGSAADEMLGPGFAGNSGTVFTPALTMEGSSVAERYRQASNYLQDQQVLAAGAQTNLNMVENIKAQEALRGEADALGRIRNADPLSVEFEDLVLDLAPAAAYSKPIARALDLKSSQKKNFEGLLNGMANSLGASGISIEQSDKLLSTAEDLLRSRNYNAFRNHVGRTLAMANQRVERNRIRTQSEEYANNEVLKDFRATRDELRTLLGSGVFEEFPEFFATGQGTVLSKNADGTPRREEALPSIVTKVASNQILAGSNLPRLSQLSNFVQGGSVNTTEVVDAARNLSEEAFISKYLDQETDDRLSLNESSGTQEKAFLKSLWDSVNTLYKFRDTAARARALNTPRPTASSKGASSGSGREAIDRLMEFVSRPVQTN
jgi:hypothetical protein